MAKSSSAFCLMADVAREGLAEGVSEAHANRDVMPNSRKLNERTINTTRIIRNMSHSFPQTET
jgi:hypothetical protein